MSAQDPQANISPLPSLSPESAEALLKLLHEIDRDGPPSGIGRDFVDDVCTAAEKLPPETIGVLKAIANQLKSASH